MFKRLALIFMLLIFVQGKDLSANPISLESKSIDSKNVRSTELSPGVYDVPIILPKSLEIRREEFRQDFTNAQTRIRNFAKQNGWESLTESSFVKQIEIFDTKNDFDNRIRSLSPEEASLKIPKTFSACIENGIFFLVAPEIYEINYADGREPDAYIKLMVHELAHRLHVAICKGDESKMGPIWFYEGFAIYAAKQLNEDKPKLSDAEIWSIVYKKDRGSYKSYNVVFRYFLKGKTLTNYLQKAGEPGFTEWLKETDNSLNTARSKD